MQVIQRSPLEVPLETSFLVSISNSFLSAFEFKKCKLFNNVFISARWNKWLIAVQGMNYFREVSVPLGGVHYEFYSSSDLFPCFPFCSLSFHDYQSSYWNLDVFLSILGTILHLLLTHVSSFSFWSFCLLPIPTLCLWYQLWGFGVITYKRNQLCMHLI